MLFPPLFEADGWKPSDKKRVLRPIVPPVSETSLRRGVQGQLKPLRRSMCGLRDKMALHGSTAKRGQFVNAQAHADKVMDAPAGPNLTPPRPVSAPKRDASRYRSLASSL